MISRVQKQLLISGIYLVIGVAIVSGFYWSENAPTCFDNIKNGKEEGVDCGTLACGRACAAPVQQITINSVQLVTTPAGDVDFAASVTNPNPEYGSSRVEYEWSGGTGIFYILPGQTKYIVHTKARLSAEASTASFKIKNVEWQKVLNESDINLIITREATTPSEDGQQTNFQAVVVNQSNYDLDNVDVNFVVVNQAGRLIATSTSNFQTFLSRTERSVKATWPFSFESGYRVIVEVGTNIFNDQNFIKSNGTQEKFQQYY